MSTTAHELTGDMVDATLEVWPHVVEVSKIDDHKTDDKSWATITLRSKEQFIITVEKV